MCMIVCTDTFTDAVQIHTCDMSSFWTADKWENISQICLCELKKRNEKEGMSNVTFWGEFNLSVLKYIMYVHN